MTLFSLSRGRALASARSSRTPSSDPLRVALTAVAFGAVFAAPAAGQGARFVVSTTADVAAAPGRVAIDDGGLVAVGAGGSARPQLFAEHWLAAAGFVPGDVDGFGRVPAASAGSAGSFAFSLLSNEGGVLDGDIALLTPGGGVEILFAEDTLASGLGVPGAALDVDGLDFDDAGRLLFSLQNDQDGTIHGTVEDGDVLRLETSGNVSIVMTEPEVQAKFSAATGLADSIGDVQAIEWTNGRLWVVTQGPSSHDGAVLDCGPAPTIVVEEDALGLDGAELDALSVALVDEELATLTASALEAAPGASLHFAVYGPPNEVYLVLKSGGAGYWPFAALSGFGGFYVDPSDPWLNAELSMTADDVIVLDGNGFFEIDYALPPGMLFGPGLDGSPGWTLQMLSAGLEVSAPVRIAAQ